MNRSVVLAATFSFCLAASPSLAGQESDDNPELITDRPDFTESAAAVPFLRLQSELGVDYSTIGVGEELTLPNLLVRFGVFKGIEVRLGAPSYVASFLGDGTSHDVGGVEIGAKGVLNLGDRWAIGILPYIVFPLKGSHFDQGQMELGGKFVWSVDFNERLALGGNLGVFAFGLGAAEISPTPNYLASLSLGLGIVDWLGAFIEIYSFSDEDFELAPVVDGGFTFPVTDTLQLDVYAGVGFLEASEGFNVGAGVSFLI